MPTLCGSQCRQQHLVAVNLWITVALSSATATKHRCLGASSHRSAVSGSRPALLVAAMRAGDGRSGQASVFGADAAGMQCLAASLQHDQLGEHLVVPVLFLDWIRTLQLGFQRCDRTHHREQLHRG